MWIGIGNIIPIIKRPIGGGTPPVGNFIELEPNLDLIELEDGNGVIELEQ
jgi:hypothetical protein